MKHLIISKTSAKSNWPFQRETKIKYFSLWMNAQLTFFNSFCTNFDRIERVGFLVILSPRDYRSKSRLCHSKIPCLISHLLNVNISCCASLGLLSLVLTELSVWLRENLLKFRFHFNNRRIFFLQQIVIGKLRLGKAIKKYWH